MARIDPKTGIFEEQDMFGLAHHPVLDADGKMTRQNTESGEIEKSTWHRLWWNAAELNASPKPSLSSFAQPPAPPPAPSPSPSAPYASSDSSDDTPSWGSTPTSVVPVRTSRNTASAGANGVVQSSGKDGISVLGALTTVAVVALAVGLVAAIMSNKSGPKQPEEPVRPQLPQERTGTRIVSSLLALIFFWAGFDHLDFNYPGTIEWGKFWLMMAIVAASVVAFLLSYVFDRVDRSEYVKRQDEWFVKYLDRERSMSKWSAVKAAQAKASRAKRSNRDVSFVDTVSDGESEEKFTQSGIIPANK